MPPSSELPVPNLFLASLPEDDLAALLPHFEKVRLTLRQILHPMRSPIEHCYFSDGGMTSLLVDLDDGASVEAGVVGKEGFTGFSALMGFEDASPFTGWPHPRPNAVRRPVADRRGARLALGNLLASQPFGLVAIRTSPLLRRQKCWRRSAPSAFLPDSTAAGRNFVLTHAYSGNSETARGMLGMADKVSEYRRTAQMLRLLAEQSRYPDTGDQLQRLAANFESQAERVASWRQDGEESSANAA